MTQNGIAEQTHSTLDLIALHKEIGERLEKAGQQYFALRGQLALVEQLITQTQAPQIGTGGQQIAPLKGV